MIRRRQFLLQGSAAIAGAAAVLEANASVAHAAVSADESTPPLATVDKRYTPVITPNGATLPYRMVDGVKVYHLTAEVVPNHEMAPGVVLECWGYNGRTPGPTIEAVEGDRVRFYVTNKLPEATTVHWHGIVLPNGMDGVAGLTQRAIAPGETFKYEFTFDRAGTFMYHPHFDEMTQMALGMMGMIVVHPKVQRRKVDRDFVMMLSEWTVKPGERRPNPLAMNDFNMLTFNSKSFPLTEPLVMKKGERVRIRYGNLGAMDHHPVHLHGLFFKVTATDGGPIAEAGQWPETTVLVPVGTTRDIEFVPTEPGDWPMHCHMTHHVMTQMGHDTPNMIGVKTAALDARMRKLVPGYMSMGQGGMGEMAEMQMPVPANSAPMRGGAGPFGYIDMGGMFTILKVRDQLDSYADPGWYKHPAGRVAEVASQADLTRDGIQT